MYTADYAPKVLGEIAEKNAALYGDSVATHFRGTRRFVPGFQPPHEPGGECPGRPWRGAAEAYRLCRQEFRLYFELFYGSAKARVIICAGKLGSRRLKWPISSMIARRRSCSSVRNSSTACAASPRTSRPSAISSRWKAARPNGGIFQNGATRRATRPASARLLGRRRHPVVHVRHDRTSEGAMLTNHNLLGMRAARSGRSAQSGTRHRPMMSGTCRCRSSHIGGSGVLVWASYDDGGRAIIISRNSIRWPCSTIS